MTLVGPRRTRGPLAIAPDGLLSGRRAGSDPGPFSILA
jgi:hypothetical protein